jgi:hypothetical protein
MSQVQAFDDALLQEHLALASRQMPGPDYYAVLRWIHEILRPANYIEIGIRKGDSLRLALPETICVGMDPEPDIQAPLPPNTRVFRITSDTFFAEEDLPSLLHSPNFGLGFIDGLHLFEQALRDFINLEKFASAQSVVMLHDCLPLDAVTADRTRTTHFYSGDVWKLTMCLKVHRPELKMKMIRTGPTGLCLVSNLDSDSKTLDSNYQRHLDGFVGLGFDDFRRRERDMPASVGNTREEVAACIAEILAR